MEHDELPSLVVGSRTQSPETIEKLLSENYEGITVTTLSDAPAEAAAADEGAADEGAAAGEDKGEPPKEGTDSSAASADAGSDAGDEEDENAGVEHDAGNAATDAAATQESDVDGRKRKSGAARAKEKYQRLAEEIETLKSQLAEKNAGRAEDHPEPEIVVPEQQPEPNPDDFDNGVYDPAYIKAVAKWTQGETEREKLVEAKERREQAATTDQQARADAEREERKQRWAEQIEIGKSRHDDFDEVMQGASSMNAAVALTEALQDSDFSGLLVYHLATHPEELKKLNKMLELPKDATSFDLRKKVKLAHREIDRLEVLINQDSGAGDQQDDSTHQDRSDTGTGSAEEQMTDSARESRAPAAAAATPPAPKAPAPVAAPPKKPEPVKPLGARNGAIRPKRVQDMTREQIHHMQQTDPDGFRKLMEASRGA